LCIIFSDASHSTSRYCNAYTYYHNRVYYVRLAVAFPSRNKAVDSRSLSFSLLDIIVVFLFKLRAPILHRFGFIIAYTPRPLKIILGESHSLFCGHYIWQHKNNNVLFRQNNVSICLYKNVVQNNIRYYNTSCIKKRYILLNKEENI
jgi:hypothetical protein